MQQEKLINLLQQYQQILCFVPEIITCNVLVFYLWYQISILTLTKKSNLCFTTYTIHKFCDLRSAVINISFKKQWAEFCSPETSENGRVQTVLWNLLQDLKCLEILLHLREKIRTLKQNMNTTAQLLWLTRLTRESDGYVIFFSIHSNNCVLNIF